MFICIKIVFACVYNFFCSYLLCISTSVCMVENNRKHSKIMKKVPLSWLLNWNFVVFDCFSTWPSHVHEQKYKKKKFQMSNQLLGVNQLLWVTPNGWPTNFFLHFSSWAINEPLIRMMEKVLFSWFSNVFHRFLPWCASMRLLVEIHNTHPNN